MEIREVSFNEIEGVLDLIDEYDRKLSNRATPEKLKLTYEALINSGSCVLGAFENNKIVGTCTVNLCANLSWSCRFYAVIENVIVTKNKRNQGIGKAILKLAQKIAEEKGCYKVMLMTGSKKEETHQFYKSAGFTGNKAGYQRRYNA